MQKNQGFYQSFFSLYVVLVLQNIITLSVNLADNMMLGAYDEFSLSGVAAANQIQFIYQQILFALGDGLVMFGSQYWGIRKTDPMKRISAVAMRTALCLAVLLFALVSLFPYQLAGLFTEESRIIEECVIYFSVIRFSYLFFAVTQILLATLRSIEVVRIAFGLSVMTFFVNCGINAVLIFGRWGAPQLGTAGAAIGTLSARILELAVLLLYIAKKDNILFLRFRDFFRIEKEVSRAYLKKAIPMVIAQGMWGLNTALQTVILGHMTAAAIAANSVASTLFLMVKSTAVGASSTASVLIGKAIGAGDMQQVHLCAKRLQKMFLGIGLCSGIFLFFIRIPILQFYDLRSETMALANTFLIILSIVNVGMSYQMPTNGGIIRGGGSAEFVVKLDFISIWMIVLPLSFFMAFVVNASPTVVVCCLNADQIFKCVPAFLKVNYGQWAKKLT